MRNASAAALCLLISLAGVSVAQTNRARKFDELSGFTCEDLKARLDNFAVALAMEQESQGIIIIYGGKKALRGEAQAWIERAEKYLFRDIKLKAKASALNGGHREARAMELWLLPKGAAPPAATPTVRPEDARFKNGSARKFVARSCAE